MLQVATCEFRLADNRCVSYGWAKRQPCSVQCSEEEEKDKGEDLAGYHSFQLASRESLSCE